MQEKACLKYTEAVMERTVQNSLGWAQTPSGGPLPINQLRIKWNQSAKNVIDFYLASFPEVLEIVHKKG